MTQAIIYVCSNCNKKFKKNLADGVEVDGSAGDCPHCSTSDGSPDNFECLRNKTI